jgi:hypothetical protein
MIHLNSTFQNPKAQRTQRNEHIIGEIHDLAITEAFNCTLALGVACAPPRTFRTTRKSARFNLEPVLLGEPCCSVGRAIRNMQSRLACSEKRLRDKQVCRNHEFELVGSEVCFGSNYNYSYNELDSKRFFPLETKCFSPR